MNVDQALGWLATEYGIIDGYHDLAGNYHATTQDTSRALLKASGLQLDSDAMVFEAVSSLKSSHKKRQYPHEVIVWQGEQFALPVADGTEWRLVGGDASQPMPRGRSDGHITWPELPFGVYDLIVEAPTGTESIRVISAPRQVPVLGDVCDRHRVWGVNAALYGLRSLRNSGLGDFQDLASVASVLGNHGADFLGINPVHSLGWAAHDVISPYSPTHRGFLNTAHIAIDKIPGLEKSAQAKNIAKDNLAATAVIRAADTVAYTRHGSRHRRALSALYRVFCTEAPETAQSALAAFIRTGGAPLRRFAHYETLSESHGQDWRNWTGELTVPPRTTEGIDPETQGRIAFHIWLQWVCNVQLSHAHSHAISSGMTLGLYLDLAVGARRGGAESWCEQDSLAQGVSLGAPPDHLGPDGQNWNLAAYAPRQIRRTKYRSYRHILRQAMRHAGVLRIDHVLGMNRSFWIPDDGSPGAYVAQPFDSLLAVTAIEACAANSVVVGEDLGLVPDGFRDRINERGIYSYSVVQYEKDDQGHFRQPDDIRAQSLVCFGTHDTPTINGFRKARDIDWWQKLNWIDADQAGRARTERAADVQLLMGLGKSTPKARRDADDIDRLAGIIHGAMAQSGVAMVSVQLDDLFGHDEAQNLPGTIGEHPNWVRRYIVPVEAFHNCDAISNTSEIMSAANRRSTCQTAKEKRL